MGLGVMLSDYTLINLVDGSMKYAAIGRIPPDALDALGWSTDLVWISSETAKKIATKHPDVDARSLRFAWAAICDGLYVREPERTDEVLVAFWDAHLTKFLFLPLKHIPGKQEIWLKTIHRAATGQLKSKCRRGEIVRKARPREWRDALQTVGPAMNPTKRSSRRTVLRPAEFHRVTLEAAYTRILQNQSVKAKAEIGVFFC